MDGSLVPDGLSAQVPLWRNLFENPLTAQFDHRLVAYAILVQDKQGMGA
jgi:cytochrome c oxidase assembly protein subunit 15